MFDLFIYLQCFLLQVMFVGASQARTVIREYEFYLPRNPKKLKLKKSVGVSDSKQERIKFDDIF